MCNSPSLLTLTYWRDPGLSRAVTRLLGFVGNIWKHLLVQGREGWWLIVMETHQADLSWFGYLQEIPALRVIDEDKLTLFFSLNPEGCKKS